MEVNSTPWMPNETQWVPVENNTYYDPCNATRVEREAVYGVTIGVGALSLIACLVVILHVMRRSNITIEIRALIHLIIANAGFCVLLVITSSFYLFPSDKTQEKSSIYLMTLKEVFYLVCFFLSANYAMVVYARLKDKSNIFNGGEALTTQREKRRVLKLAYLLSWILPAILLFPVSTSVLDEPIHIQLCLLCPSVTYYPRDEHVQGKLPDSWFLQNYGYIVTIASYIVVVVFITMFFILSLRVASYLLNHREMEVRKAEAVRWLRSRLVMYTLSFFFSWTLTFILAIVGIVEDLTDVALSNCIVLYYVWAVTSPSQGLLICVIYFYCTYFQPSRQPSLINRGKRPFGSRVYRFYGTGEQRSVYRRARSPSSVSSDGSPFADTTPSSSDGAIIVTSSPGIFSSKRKPRSPSFVAFLKEDGK